jgi:hypothetical protein
MSAPGSVTDRRRLPAYCMISIGKYNETDFSDCSNCLCKLWGWNYKLVLATSVLNHYIKKRKQRKKCKE